MPEYEIDEEDYNEFEKRELLGNESDYDKGEDDDEELED